jgi:serine protease
VLHLHPGTTREQAIAAHASLKADRRLEFVSNVYKVTSSGDDVIPVGRVAVRFKNGVSSGQVDSLSQALGLPLIRPPRPDSGFNYFVFGYPPDSASPMRIAALLYHHPLVAWADPDFISNRHADYVPTDAYYPQQYYLKNGVLRDGVAVDDNVEPAWDITIGQWSPASGGLRVGVIGTGVDAAHPDFDGRIISGYDAMSCSPGCSDSEISPFPSTADMHETAVAGIIVGHHNNGGMAGIAPGVYVIATRIFRNGQPAADQGIADAINFTWYYKNAHVLSNSCGGGAPSDLITNAIRDANTSGRGGAGTVVVFAGGNTSQRSHNPPIIGALSYPATLAEVVAVGAIDVNGNLTDYSPEGSELDIVAPSGAFTGICSGGNVVTADLSGPAGCNDGPSADQDYTTTFTGTSAACPQVAAVVALIISRDNTLTSSAVKTRLYQGADPWGAATQFGAGKLNALKSVTNVVVTISGSTTIRTAGNYTWTASATGGSGGYNYTWEASLDGGAYSTVATGPSYSRYVDASSFITMDLRVTAVSGVESGVKIKRVNNLIVP